MSTINFHCPHCGQLISANATQAGVQGRCAKCSGGVVVPRIEQGSHVLASPTPRTLGDCPYCRTSMQNSDRIRECPACRTPHHGDCWIENKGCTVFGCSMAPPDEEKVAVQVPSAAVGALFPGRTHAASVSSAGRAELQLQNATSGRRLGNYFLDAVFYWFFLITFWAFVGVIGGATGGDLTPFIESAFIINMALLAGYYIIFEGAVGRTPGKLITGTKVVTEDGGTPTFGQVVGRTLSRFVPFEPFSFFGSEPRGWHDRWSGTRVVLTRHAPAGAVLSVQR